MQKIMGWIYRKYFKQLVLNEIDHNILAFADEIRLIKNRTDVAVAADICVGRDPGFIVIATRVGTRSFVEIIDMRKPRDLAEWKKMLDSLRAQFEPRERLYAPRGMSDFLY